MENLEVKTPKKDNDTPIATMVIREYKEFNKSYVKTNKRLIAIIIILLALLVVETTYIIVSWDSIHPHAGIINK